MNKTIPLCENYEFRRLYSRGKSAVFPLLVVYVQKNRRDSNRLGLTAGKKVGGAVKRNRARRLLREAYRLLEPQLNSGFDIVIVARGRTAGAVLSEVQTAMQEAFLKLGVSM